ncbi:MAG TPA: hypothetical protein VGD80_32075, partial [Kofleriaceae bacterium]
ARLRVVIVGEAIAGADVPAAAEPMAGASAADRSAAMTASSPGADAPVEELGQLVFLGHPGHAPPWQVTGPQALRSERAGVAARRDAHRRTRRAKPRRRPAVVQSQLFGNR